MASRAAVLFEFSRPFTLVAPALGFASGAATAAGAFPREALTQATDRLPADRSADGRGVERRVERAQSDLRPRHRSHQQAASAVAVGTTLDADGLAVHGHHLRRGAGPGLDGRPGWTSRVFLDRRHCDRDHVRLLGAAVPHQAARHLGQRDDRHSTRRAAQGRRVVGGEDRRRRRAVVHRRDLRTVPAGRVHDQGFRGHGG